MLYTKQAVLVLSITLLWLRVGCRISTAETGDEPRGNRMLAAYFREETRALSDECLADVKTWGDWTRRRETFRHQLREMLGLDPLPERTPLKPIVTGTVEHADFTVEKLHFQSRPQLYVTANLYVPKGLKEPAPAVLYLCGHSAAKKDGVSFGNKTQFQHHGAWFARNGYACLVIDTLQLGEIEGIHHGTNRENMWWWNAAGYTPAGVEAWNAIRALDYLESRPEVDAKRLGVTGRSGGGAYSWWLTAIDDRVKVAVPVAGITNLKNHVVDDCVEGHCDCMYLVNTYRWDYAQVAALAAPRPLLLANTDHDDIFPLDGVLDVYHRVRRLYELAGQAENLGLQIAAGPHDDTQVLQLHAFQWFNHHLKGDDAPIDSRSPSYFEPEQLKVFDKLPSDEINTRVHETFTKLAAEAAIPATAADWHKQRSAWLADLREKCFHGWPDDKAPRSDPRLRRVFEALSKDAKLSAYEFDSQENFTLRFYVLVPNNVPTAKFDSIVLHVLDADGWSAFVTAMRRHFAEKFANAPTTSPASERLLPDPTSVLEDGRALAYLAPRGIGPTAWDDSDMRKQIHIRRRFMLLGQTLDGMRVWDTRRAIQALRSVDGLTDTPIWLNADGDMAAIALYAALFEPAVAGIELRGLPKSHREGPDFLNVLRVFDVPQAVAMVAENSEVRIDGSDPSDWEFPAGVARKFGWQGRIEIQNENGDK